MDIKFILDTSVAVKWFSGEKENHLDKAQSLFDDIQNKTIQVATLEILLIELTNALLISKKVKSQDAIEASQILLDSPIVFTPFSPVLLTQAIKLTSVYRLTIYDALFVALAQEKNCLLLTADTKLALGFPNSLLLENYESNKA